MRPKPRELLAKAECGIFLVTNPVHLQYLTQSDVESGFLLVERKRYTLFTNLHFLNQPEKFKKRGIHLHPPAELGDVLKKIRSAGVEDSVTLSDLARWKKKWKGTAFVPKQGVVEFFRRQKDAEELRLMARARRITQQLLKKIPSLLQSSVTEQEVAKDLHILALQLGAEGMAFPSIVAFGENSASLHHRPGNRRLKSGDLVQIDIGAKFGGYCADMSEVFFTRPQTEEQSRIYRALKRAKKSAGQLVKEGVHVHELDEAAQKVLRAEGIEEAFVHSLGHGVGREVHEGVTLSSKDRKTKLLKNEVVTIEPGVYFPGKFGMRVEDTVTVG